MVNIQQTNHNHKKPDGEKEKAPVYYISLLYFNLQGQIHPAIMQERSTPS